MSRIVVVLPSHDCHLVERIDGKCITLGDVFGYFDMAPSGSWKWVHLFGETDSLLAIELIGFEDDMTMSTYT